MDGGWSCDRSFHGSSHVVLSKKCMHNKNPYLCFKISLARIWRLSGLLPKLSIMPNFRHTQPNFSRKASFSGKQSVPQPTSIGKFAIILLMHICKKILLVDTWWKIGIYLCGITIGSLFTDLFPMPRSAYLAGKNNFVNVYFVKYGWGWTFTILGIFIYMTSFVYCCGNQKLVRQHLSRLAFGTLSWYFSTSLFEHIEHITGFCDSGLSEHSTKRLCHKEGSSWLGFDISGHAFLLIHCLLTISEEVKCINGWERIADVIQTEETTPTGRLTTEELQVLKSSYTKHLPYVRVIVAILVIFQLMWELMLLITTLFFHNMPQKLMGGAFGVLSWFLLYQLWFKGESIPPGPPGKGLFKFMKED